MQKILIKGNVPSCPICGKPMEEIREDTFVCVNKEKDCGTGGRVWALPLSKEETTPKAKEIIGGYQPTNTVDTSNPPRQKAVNVKEESQPIKGTPEHLNITQWVIDNRYPKSENDKISDFELYTELAKRIESYAQQRVASLEEEVKELKAELSRWESGERNTEQ